ncbi:MAG: hypothetical protein QG641_2058, partial [Candidatus Poribacteria bacterium]|nr:hypothetical protein [Candidatus Poribacteria bacterium]
TILPTALKKSWQSFIIMLPHIGWLVFILSLVNNQLNVFGSSEYRMMVWDTFHTIKKGSSDGIRSIKFPNMESILCKIHSPVNYQKALIVCNESFQS